MSRTSLHWHLRKTLREVLSDDLAMGEHRVSRRIVCQLAASGVLSPHFVSAKGRLPASRVVIIGAGLAGLSAAYSLTRVGIRPTMYEGSTRYGGRAFTKYNFNSDKMFVELGGEFVNSDHTALRNLASKVGVELQDLQAADRGRDYYCFQGQHFTAEDLVPLIRPLVEAIANDQKQILDDDGKYTAHAKKLDGMSLKAYLRQRSENVSDWLRDLLEVLFVAEFGLEADEQSALNLVDFTGTNPTGFKPLGKSDERFRIKGGSSALPKALHAAIHERVVFHNNSVLRAIKRRGNEFLLTVNKETVVCDQLILAVPFSVLREVEGIDELDITDTMKTAIATMGHGDNVKLMLGFKGKWWRTAEATTLPAESNGAFVADFLSGTYWETSRQQSGDSGILTNYLGGNLARRFSHEYKDRALAQLQQLSDEATRAFSADTATFNWPKFKFTKCSYNGPTIGQYTTVFAVDWVPQLKGQLVFAGTQTSAEHWGYMNGAVDSGLRAASQLVAAF